MGPSNLSHLVIRQSLTITGNRFEGAGEGLRGLIIRELTSSEITEIENNLRRLDSCPLDQMVTGYVSSLIESPLTP